VSVFKRQEPPASVKGGPGDGALEYLRNPLSAQRNDLASNAGRLAAYSDAGAGASIDERPLLLVHSVNAAASTFDETAL
jgi:hypothetical protein